MKSPKFVSFAVLLSIAPTFAAEIERAPELPELSQFRSALRETPAPAAAQGKTVIESAKPGCPVPDLNGAVIGRGFVGTTFDVKVGGKAAGTIASEGDGYVFKDARGSVVAKTSPQNKSWGTKSEVTDCSGEKIGGIQEEYALDGSNFTVSDAQGNPYANTGWTDSTSVSLKTGSGETVGAVKNASHVFDKFTIKVTPKTDGRILALLAVLNNAAAYKRSAAKEREAEEKERQAGRPGAGGRRY